MNAAPHRPPPWRGHLGLFLLLGGLLASAWILGPVPESSSHLQVGGFTLPHLCTFRRVTDKPCPGCGLTRSWVAAADARWHRSYAYHRLGLPILLFVALQALRHGLWLVVPRARRQLDVVGAQLDWTTIPLTVLLLLNGVVVLLTAPDAAM